MVAIIKMNQWTSQLEKELTLLIKDWLKQQNKSQKDLKNNLQGTSERMPALLEILKKDFSKGGLQNLVKRLCNVELSWSNNNQSPEKDTNHIDPFDQLDLLIEEIEEDCNS